TASGTNPTPTVFEIANTGFVYPMITAVLAQINAQPVVQAGSTENANAGDIVRFGVQFSGTVFVSGTPTITLSNGVTLSYLSGSGTTTLDFTYDVQPGQATPNLTITSFNLNGGKVYDTFLHNALLSNLAITGTVEIEQSPPPPPTNLADAGIINGF